MKEHGVDWYLSHKGLVNHEGVWYLPSTLAEFHLSRCFCECQLRRSFIRKRISKTHLKDEITKIKLRLEDLDASK